MSPLKIIPRSLLLFSVVILMELEYNRVAPQPTREFITVTYKPIVVNSFEEMMEHTKGVPGRIVVLNRKLLRGKPGQPKMIYRIILKNEEEDDKQENANNEIAGNELNNDESDRIDNEITENDEFGDDNGDNYSDENKYDINTQDDDKYEDIQSQ